MGFVGFFDRIVGAGNCGNVGATGQLAAGGFRAEGFHGFGGRADEDETGFFAGAGKRGIFSEEAVTGVDGVAAGAAGNVDELVDAQIAFAGRRGADGIGFVGQTDVEGGAVGFAEDGDGADAEFAAGAENATERMPSSRQARRMRTAISPRLAIRILLNMRVWDAARF